MPPPPPDPGCSIHGLRRKGALAAGRPPPPRSSSWQLGVAWCRGAAGCPLRRQRGGSKSPAQRQCHKEKGPPHSPPLACSQCVRRGSGCPSQSSSLEKGAESWAGGWSVCPPFKAAPPCDPLKSLHGMARCRCQGALLCVCVCVGGRVGSCVHIHAPVGGGQPTHHCLRSMVETMAVGAKRQPPPELLLGEEEASLPPARLRPLRS